MFKELKEQYAYLWWWLLEKGIVGAGLIVGSFLVMIFAVCMLVFYHFINWYSKHLN